MTKAAQICTFINIVNSYIIFVDILLLKNAFSSSFCSISIFETYQLLVQKLVLNFVTLFAHTQVWANLCNNK